MSVTRDNSSNIVDKQIRKIIPKNIKKNLVEYDSNPFEKKIEDKISKFHKGKKEKEKEKKIEMLYDKESKIDNLLLSIEKNNANIKVYNNHLSHKSKSKLKNNLRTSSAVNLRNTNNFNDSFHFKDPSLINSSSKIDFNPDRDKYNSPEKKLAFKDFAKNDLDKARKKREQILKEYSFNQSHQKKIVNNKGKKFLL